MTLYLHVLEPPLTYVDQKTQIFERYQGPDLLHSLLYQNIMT